MIINALKYLFYRVYIWQLHNFGETSSPLIPAIGSVLLTLYLNYLTLDLLIEIISGVDVVSKYALPMTHGVVFVIIILFAVRYIQKNNTCEKLIKEYQNQSKSEWRKGTWIAWGLPFGSLFVTCIALYFDVIAGDSHFTLIHYLQNLANSST